MTHALPPSWATVPLGSVLSRIEAGASFRCEERPPREQETGVAKVSAVTWGEYDEEESKTVLSSDRIDERFLIRPGDFLFSRANTISLVGACVIARRVSRRVMLSDKILRFHFAGVDPAYVLHFLRSPAGRSEIERLSTGNQESMRNIGQDRIKAIQLPFPPLAEQRHIVAALEEHLSGLDAAVAGLTRARANLARYRASTIVHAVLGDTVGAATPDAEHALPSGWQWRTTAECCTKIDSGSTPPPDKMYPGEGEIPFIKVYNLTMTGLLDFSVRPTFVDRTTHEGRLRRSRLVPGDVLTNIVGPPLGKVAVVPDTHPEWNTNQAVVCFRTGPSIINSYLALMLQADPVIKRLSSQARATAGQSNVSLTMCRTLRIPVPPIDEQRRILLETEGQLELCNRVGADIDAQLARARSLRQSILQRAFGGRLVPQDLADEPAAALLGQVRRATTATTDRTSPRRAPRSRT